MTTLYDPYRYEQEKCGNYLWIEHTFGKMHVMTSSTDQFPEGRPGASALVELLSAVPADLTDGEVTDGLVALVDLSGRVQAALARFTASFDARSLPAVDGARSAPGWMAARTEISRPAAVAALACGRDLRQCPHVDAASSDGRLGMAKVRMLLEARLKLEPQFAEHELLLVDEVAPLTVAEARVVIDRWRAVMLATVGLDDAIPPREDPELNSVHLSSTFEGRWRLDGDLDAVTGEALANALDQWIDRGVRDGRLDPSVLKRSGLRAQALSSLVGVGARGSSPHHQARADVHLTWDAADLMGQPVASMADLARRRCITDRGVSLSRFAADQALCNADIHDLLVLFGLDGTRTVLGVTHTRRYPTANERAALVERDRGCVFPGCDAPVGWCDAHHTVPYEIGHRTRLDELVLLCPHHHRLVHRGFCLTRSPDGRVEVTRPDGSRLDPDPPEGRVCPDPRYKLPPPTRFAA